MFAALPDVAAGKIAVQELGNQRKAALTSLNDYFIVENESRTAREWGRAVPAGP